MAKRKPYFETVDTKVNFPVLEKKLLNLWYKKGVDKKYLKKNSSSAKYFSFLDGPITANNPMGVHHAWGRTYKDIWQRYFNMKGFKQRFQNGFDCQGLWVEVEVEKELGLKSKKDIENLVPGNKKASIARFVELCKERVYKYAKIQTEQSKRLGYFMDWDHSYFTLSDANNYMIWHFLKTCYENELIYKGHDSVPWCPRCGTAISQHEMLTEDYKELTHDTVFFKLPCVNNGFSFIAWTTTPWTIPGNVALAINPKFTYRVVQNKQSKEKLLLLKEDQVEGEAEKDFIKSILPADEWENIKDYKGEELVGLKYEGPFDNLERIQKAKAENSSTFHTVLAAEDLVVATKGTGILHVAPGQGEEDFTLGNENGLSVIELIDEEGNYYDGLGEFSSKNAKKHPELIIDHLKDAEKGKYLLKISKITHRYPACWRCKTELVWRVVDEWYISMDKPLNGKKSKDEYQTLREKMIEVAKKIRWIPEFGLERELDWLKNMHDWLISKKRYWGLALPIWECGECGHFEVIGSKEELRDKAVEGWDGFVGKLPHRPWVDEIKIRCKICGHVSERITDVGNPWLDAGIVPFSTVSKDNFGEPLYSSDKNEWRKWFPVDFITESFPGQFKNWFYSLIAMSTVLENSEPFKTVLGFATLLAEDGRPMHKSWGNAIEFNEGAEKIGVDVMRFMYIKQNPSDNLLFGYRIADEVRRKFHLKLWNVYNFFVTYANLDSWQPGKNTNAGSHSTDILDRWILSRLKELISEVSKNLDEFNVYQAGIALESFLEDLSNWYIRRSRKRVGIVGSDEDKDNFYKSCYLVLTNLSKLLAPLLPYLSESIYINLTKEETVHLSDWPEFDYDADEKLLKEMADARILVEKAHSLRKDKGIPLRQPLSELSTVQPKTDKDIENLIKDEINIKNIKWSAKMKNNDIFLDTNITPELKEEASTRELIRKIQEERKYMGINLTQKIIVKNDWLPDSNKFIQLIKKVTLTSDISLGNFEVKKTSENNKA